jgi:hypothetical protein
MSTSRKIVYLLELALSPTRASSEGGTRFSHQSPHRSLLSVQMKSGNTMAHPMLNARIEAVSAVVEATCSTGGAG